MILVVEHYQPAGRESLAWHREGEEEGPDVLPHGEILAALAVEAAGLNVH